MATAVEQPSCLGGDDTLNGGNGTDLAIGDLIECGFDFNGHTVRAETQMPLCEGGDDTLNGGDGADFLFGDEFSLMRQVCDVWLQDNVIGAADPLPPMIYNMCGPVGGDDTVNGDAGNDYAEGGGGDDAVNGGTDNDFLLGDESPFLLLYLIGDDEQSGFGFGEDFDPTDLDEEELEELFDFLLEYDGPDHGNDIVTGDEGSDILAGNGGHDVVCGDLDDIMLVGGPGTDVPCPVFTGLLDATGGPVSGDLSTDIRELDDEFAESGPLMMSLNGNGTPMEPNPYEFIITKEPTKGTVVFDPITGEFTYTPDPGETGLDNFEYTLRRKIIENHAAPAVEPGVNDDGFIYSITRIVEFFLGDPPPAVQPRAIARVAPAAQTAGAQLPATGVETTGMALMGFGFLLFGALAFLESQRRQTAVIRSQAHHLARN